MMLLVRMCTKEYNVSNVTAVTYVRIRSQLAEGTGPMKNKKKNLTRLASISALGAGALTVGAHDADAAVIYTVFALPNNTVGFSPGTGGFFSINPIAPGGVGGFNLARNYSYTYTGPRSSYRSSRFFQLLLQGVGSLQFQDAPGVGFMWNATAPVWSSSVLRSKKSVFRYGYSTFTTGGSSYSEGPPSSNRSVFSSTTYQMLRNRNGDFYLLFQFNPTGSQTDYGWLHLFAPPVNGCVRCEPDIVAVDMAWDDTGAFIAAGDTGSSSTPEPATAIPTGIAALALGANGVRRWRASRKKAA